jgi:hypothetical protein
VQPQALPPSGIRSYLFLGLGDIEDREKKQFLREIKKSIKRSKFKFLKVNGDQALPNLAKFFPSDLHRLSAQRRPFWPTPPALRL